MPPQPVSSRILPMIAVVRMIADICGSRISSAATGMMGSTGYKSC